MKLQIDINEDVLEKFNLALMLNKEDANNVIATYMMQYISSSFSKASFKTPTKAPHSDYGKAKLRIPKWAKKSQQYNHKIIRAYFMVEGELGFVPLNSLEKRCSVSHYLR